MDKQSTRGSINVPAVDADSKTATTVADSSATNSIHLVLDVDGTLVNELMNLPVDCSTESMQHILDDQMTARPHLEHFLEICFATCKTVSIWTAASDDWYKYIYNKHLKPILDKLNVKFTLQFTRKRCTARYTASGLYSNGILYEKRLKKMQKRKWINMDDADETNMLIVDDTPHTYYRNYGNAIAVERYYGGDDDTLLRLAKKIQLIAKEYRSTGNVRYINKCTY